MEVPRNTSRHVTSRHQQFKPSWKSLETRHVTSPTVQTFMEVPSSSHVPFANNKDYQFTANSYFTVGRITLFRKIHAECYLFMTHLTPIRVPDTARSLSVCTASQRPNLFQQAIRAAQPLCTDQGKTSERTVRLGAGI